MPALTPYTARPRIPALAAIGLSVLLVGGSLAAYYLGLDADARALITGFQLVTLIFFVLLMVAIMLGVGLCFIRADEHGLTFRNGIRTHRLPWEAVRGIRYSSGDPWPYVMLDVEFAGDTGDRVMMMGIQSSDGAYAARQVERLREAVTAYQEHHS